MVSGQGIFGVVIRPVLAVIIFFIILPLSSGPPSLPEIISKFQNPFRLRQFFILLNYNIILESSAPPLITQHQLIPFSIKKPMFKLLAI